MVRTEEPEVARASNALWASAASLHPIVDLQTPHILPDRLHGPCTFETRNKGNRLRVVSGAVINIDVALSSSEPRERPSAEFASHEAYRFPQQHEFPNTLMQDRKFRHFIIITIIVPLEHDSVFVGKTL